MSLGGEYRMLEKIIDDKRKELNKLVAKKKEIGEKLRVYMEEKKIENFQGVQFDEIAPKQKEKRMTKKEKEEMALKKLRQVGVPNPRALLSEMGI
jgi:hypothetical protein